MLNANKEQAHIKFAFLVHPTPDQINQIVTLYRMVGWWEDSVDEPDSVIRIISGSHCFVAALINDEIVGIGRAISDGVSDSYIQDITVKESFRKQGIGEKIVKELIVRLKKDGLNWIALIAERGTHEFYERIGFIKMPNSTPMIISES